ncbi:hypothetical protein BAE44_0016136 [Dichanthelium oligosanthes]|uniref:Uncharacterized protein n=1 Tax=Dichanthelium oligosanthes TaxID=888268 RepID=A0A1E5VCH1_9POAL|nr:hypothetical protein BAE44_0016136 [Dichanthelium oligosanthes]
MTSRYERLGVSARRRHVGSLQPAPARRHPLRHGAHMRVVAADRGRQARAVAAY